MPRGSELRAPVPTVAIVLHKLAATGVARNALATANHMRQAGWRVTLITMQGGGELAGLADGFDWRVLGGMRLGRKLEMVLAIAPLRRELGVLSPEVVLSAGNHAHRTVLAAAKGLSGAARPATVCRISNDLTHNASWRNPLAFLSLRRSKARRVAKDAARLVLVSPHLATDPILREALHTGRARVIANGVDRDRVRALAQAPYPHPWADESVPIVLAVGRMTSQKNFPTLIAAFAQVRQQRAVRLIIVGGGKRRARVRLERLVRESGLVQDVAFVGRTANPFPYFRAASVFALPSVWEGSPNVLLEALACELPVVASALAGSAAEVLDHGRYGLLVDPYDAAAMAQALVIQLDPARQVRPGDRVDSYALSRSMAQYQALFEELVRARD